MYFLAPVDASKPAPSVIGDMCLALDTGSFYVSPDGAAWVEKGGGGGAPPSGTGYVLVAGGAWGVPVAAIPAADVDGLGGAAALDVGTSPGTVAAGDDSRLSNARAPTTLLSTGSAGPTAIGYAAGAGGAVTQTANKSNGVTLNKLCGQITMNGAALAAAAEVSFVVTNSLVASTDVVLVCIQSVGTPGAYFVAVGAVSNGSFAITVGNASAGSLSQAIVLNFVVIKGVAA